MTPDDAKDAGNRGPDQQQGALRDAETEPDRTPEGLRRERKSAYSPQRGRNDDSPPAPRRDQSRGH